MPVDPSAPQVLGPSSTFQSSLKLVILVGQGLNLTYPNFSLVDGDLNIDGTHFDLEMISANRTEIPPGVGSPFSSFVSTFRARPKSLNPLTAEVESGSKEPLSVGKLRVTISNNPNTVGSEAKVFVVESDVTIIAI